MERRTFLGGLLAAGAAAGLGSGRAEARERREAPADAVGLLVDSTRCIGCQACMSACRKANGDGIDDGISGRGLYHAPRRLSSDARTVILSCSQDGTSAYFKKQCMHCLDPACASVCMLGALARREHGIVTYDADKCIGCRYCQVACPFDVPRFEWDRALPLIVKCELCSHRIADGLEPACAAACPRQAITYGTRDALIAEGEARIAAEPARYQHRVYGVDDGGGSQVLVLGGAAMPFGALGLPSLGNEGVPDLSETLQHGIYRGFIAPIALYGLLGAVLWRNRSRAVHVEDEEARDASGGTDS